MLCGTSFLLHRVPADLLVGWSVARATGRRTGARSNRSNLSGRRAVSRGRLET